MEQSKTLRDPAPAEARPGRGRTSAIAACLLAACLSPLASRAEPEQEPEPAEPRATEPLPIEAPAVEPQADGDEAIVFQEIPSVYGVSRFEQKITEAPSFVTLVTADEISKFGYRTLAEVLQSVTGFFVTYDRNYNYLGIRGFNRPGDFNSRVLLLVDGHRLNDNLYDQAGLGTESLIDVDLIDRVEVIRGPSSSLYGTNAFFGVINVITKRGRDIRGVEVSGEVGSFDTNRGRLTVGDRIGSGVEFVVSGSYYDSEGEESLYYPEFDDPATNSGITRDADDDEFPSFFAKAQLRGLTLQGGYVSREKGIPTASYGTYFPTDETRSTDEHGYLFLKYDHQFASQLNLSSRVYYDRFYYQGDYLYDVAAVPPADLVLNRDRSTGEWWGAEVKANQRLFGSHNVTAGLEYRDDFRQDLWNADVGPSATLLDDERDAWNAAVFLQDEISIRENLLLSAGIRHDYYDSFGGTFNPRLALIYNMENTTLKALYGTAFRGANAYERFYVGTGFKANPDLDPETVATYELVVEHSLTKYLRATAAGYYYTIGDLVSQETDPNDGLLVFMNRGEIEARGLELQLEMDERGPLKLSGRLGYALQQARDLDADRRLTNSPQHLVNLNLVAPLLGDVVFAGLEAHYTSARRTLLREETDDFAVVHLTLLTKNMIDGLEVSATVRNLLDEEYSDPGSGEQVQDQLEQDGRSFWLKVKYSF